MGTHAKGPNTQLATCENCGQQLAAGEGLVYEVWDYPWDGSDGEGSITQMVDRYTICQMATDCARRVVAQGTNLRALRQVARDYENLGELATQAREILNEWAAWRREEARTADLVAREDGWGVIGGPRGGR